MAENTGHETTAATGIAMLTTRRAADLLASSMMLVFITSAVTLSLLPVVTNELRTSVGLTEAQIGLLTSVFMGFYAVAGISSGIAAARWGGRLLGVSCGCFVVGSLIFGLSSGMTGFSENRSMWKDALRRVRIVYEAMTEHGPPSSSFSYVW